jgi:hypothetical protein
MKVEDYSINAPVGPVLDEKGGHEKGGKLNGLRCHHNLAGIGPE